jgi:hypothetical protein
MYAKEFFANTTLISDPGLCFVLMPFAAGFDAAWDSVRNTVEGNPFNLLCRRADDIASPGHVMTSVLENIGRSRLLIAELSGQNPNVFYELGIAHSVKDPAQVILIASDISAIPFDLRHLRCIVYGGDLAKLSSSLTTTLTELGVRQYRLDLSEGEVGRVPARLTGDDHCLYEVEIRVDYIGDDGVKFGLRLLRYTTGAEPVEVRREGHYLGVAQPAMKIPEMPWSLCYHRPSRSRARFIFGRPPGWHSTREV